MNELKLFIDKPLDKATIRQVSKSAIESFLSGNQNPLELELRLRDLEEIIKTIRSNPDVKDYVMDEALKFGKSFELSGRKITITGRTTKDYSTCGDSVWLDLNKQIETLKLNLKAREKIIDSGVDISTGETFDPPMEKRTEFLKVEFLK